MRNQKGITLISLIITIIIMLILAAVSISMVVGEGSIINRSIEAKEKNQKAQEKEYQDLEKLGTSIDNISKGIVTGISASDITKEDIGKKVKYDKTYITYDNVECSDWEILYADTENVYLIASTMVIEPDLTKDLMENHIMVEYSKEELALTETEMSENGRYPSAKKVMVSYLNDELTAPQNNDIGGNFLMLYMLDSKNVWNPLFKNEYADWVIGGPTLDLIYKSIDKVHSLTGEENMYEKLKNDYKLNGKYSYTRNDYFLQGPWAWKSPTYNNGVSYQNDLGYLTCNIIVKEKELWIGPFMNGSLRYFDWAMYDSKYGFRPVVCLSSGTTFITDKSRNEFEIE